LYRLSHHYDKCSKRKQEAFKYSVKASDRYISLGAYEDGLIYAQKAFTIITKKNTTTDQLEFTDVTTNEYYKLIHVVECALRDMTTPIRRKSRKVAYRNLKQKAADPMYHGYQELEWALEKSLQEFIEKSKVGSTKSRKRRSEEEDADRRYSLDDGAPDWQPSYAGSIKSSVKSKPKPSNKTEPPVKSLCIIC
jgi:hypothetical protein